MDVTRLRSSNFKLEVNLCLQKRVTSRADPIDGNEVVFKVLFHTFFTLSQITYTLPSHFRNKKPLFQRRNKGYPVGRRDWTRTNDPHHVKVVL